MTEVTDKRHPARAIVVFVYGLAAATSLAYQVIWIKALALIFGMTAIAVGTVLAVYLSGVGVGGFLVARLARGRFSPMKWFAAVEIGLGAYALVLPGLFRWSEAVYLALAPATESPAHVLLRSVVTLALLIVPCILIGSVFPLLSRIARSVGGSEPRGLGVLYFTGLTASALGALFTGIVLLPWAGLEGSLRTMAAVNLTVGLLAAGVWHRLAPGEEPPSPGRGRWRGEAGNGIAVAAGGLGLALLGAELVWMKLAWLVVDNTAYAESMVIGTLLLAMAAGSAGYLLLTSRGRTSPATSLIVGLVLVALFQLLLLPAMESIARLFNQLLHYRDWVGPSVGAYLTAQGILTLAIAGLPAMGYGYLFACLCHLASARGGGVAFQIGRLYGWHNWGAAVGSILAAFVLIPMLGLTWAIVLLSWILLFIAYRQAGALLEGAKFKGWGRALPAAVGLLTVFLLPADVTYRHRAAGDGQRVLFHHEGPGGIVEVFEDKTTGYRSLLSSRLRQEGGDGPEQSYIAKVQGYLPLLLHPNPERVLVVGMGTGITLVPFRAREVRDLTVVEISRGVIEAARLFERVNGTILKAPKTRIVHQDGRNFVKLTRRKYDLIVQELFFPYRSGVGNLYSAEHYAAMRQRLLPGGLAAQWIALNQVSVDTLRSLVGTVASVFPHVSLWIDGGYLLILAGDSPLRVNLPSFLKRFSTPQVAADLSLNRNADPYDFLGAFIGTGPALAQWSRGATINTDDNAHIEYQTPRYFRRLNTVGLALDNISELIQIKGSLPAVVEGASPEEETDLKRAELSYTYLLKGIKARGAGDLEAARRWYEQGYRANPANYQLGDFIKRDHFERGHRALQAGHWERAADLLDRSLVVDPNFTEALFERALIHAHRGDLERAAALYRRILERRPGFSKARFNLGISFYRMGRYALAAEAFDEVVSGEPRSVDARFNLANSLAQLGRYGEAVQQYRHVVSLDPGYPDAHANLTAVLRRVRQTQSMAVTRGDAVAP